MFSPPFFVLSAPSSFFSRCIKFSFTILGCLFSFGGEVPNRPCAGRAGGVCSQGSLGAKAGRIPGCVCVCFPSLTKNEPPSPANGCVCVCVRGGTRWELGLISLIPGWLQSIARSGRPLILDLSGEEAGLLLTRCLPVNTFSTFSVPGHSVCPFLSERHL